MFTTKTPAVKTNKLSKFRTHQLQFRPPAIKAAIIKTTTELIPSSYSSLYLALKTEAKMKPRLNMHVTEEVTENIKPTTIEATTNAVHMETYSYSTTRSNFETFDITQIEDIMATVRFL